jgi:hypothetical protein
MTAGERKLLDFVAKQAATTIPSLPQISDRIRLLEGIALIAAPAEAEQSRITAAHYRQAEASQLVLGDMLAEKS